MRGKGVSGGRDTHGVGKFACATRDNFGEVAGSRIAPGKSRVGSTKYTKDRLNRQKGKNVKLGELPKPIFPPGGGGGGEGVTRGVTRPQSSLDTKSARSGRWGRHDWWTAEWGFMWHLFRSIERHSRLGGRSERGEHYLLHPKTVPKRSRQSWGEEGRTKNDFTKKPKRGPSTEIWKNPRVLS